MINILKRIRRQRSYNDVETLLWKNHNFAATEAYKLLRTNLLFTLPDESKCRVIGITSSTRGEGKSTTSINLSYVLSQAGKKVLLIDADLRLPSVAKKLEIPSKPGLSESLILPEFDTSAIQKAPEGEWDVLTAGSIPPNPSELLGSEHMQRYVGGLAEQYDFIIVDLPPINIVSDALALSAVLDGMIVVVRNDYSEKRELNKCLRSMALSKVRILGVMMNAKRDGVPNYSRYRRYRRHNYYYENDYGYSSAKAPDQDAKDQTETPSAASADHD